jgi:hypothetical protein
MNEFIIIHSHFVLHEGLEFMNGHKLSFIIVYVLFLQF